MSENNKNESEQNRELALRTTAEQKALHVSLSNGSWWIISDGTTEPIATFEHRDEAIANGRQQARERGADLVLLDADGLVEGREVHGAGRNGNGAVFHVFPGEDGWTVQHGAVDEEPLHFQTKKEAVSKARDLAREAGGELLIHKRDGSVGAEHIYAAG